MAGKRKPAAERLSIMIHTNFRRDQKKALYEASKILRVPAGEIVREAVGDWLKAHAEASVTAASTERQKQ